MKDLTYDQFVASNIHQDQFRDATKMVPDLKPCPFCGATKDDSEIIEPTEDCVEPSLSLHAWNHGDGHVTYLVQCARCDVHGPTSYQLGRAIQLWNTRCDPVVKDFLTTEPAPAPEEPSK